MSDATSPAEAGTLRGATGASAAPPAGSAIRRVSISTGSRLHFGLLSVGRTEGRQFGGVGMMIREPGWTLTVRPLDPSHPIAGPESAIGLDRISVRGTARLSPARQIRIAELLRQWRELTGIALPPVEIEISAAIPEHVGLGSGTQLALALHSALHACTQTPLPELSERSFQAGRGRRSGIGSHGFEQGGWLIEAGKSAPDGLSPLLGRISFPEEWPILLIRPTDDQGLSGDAELCGFRRLPPMPSTLTDRLASLLLLELWPAVIERRYDLFAAALTSYGRLVGSYFAPAQGDVYSHPRMQQFEAAAAAAGATAVAQTSWGPTLAVICADAATAACVRSELSRRWPQGDIEVQQTHALNEGARLQLLD